MDVNRVIDLWQVVLQDPRVATKKAWLLIQAELSQQMARDEGEKKQHIIEHSVEQSNKAEAERVISGEKEKKKGKEREQFIMRRSQIKINRKPKKRRNTLSKDHVDIMG